jgi:hypothetical protein
MTVLSAASSASVRLLGRKLTALFSSTNTFEMELADLATETAVAIAKEHEWQKLKTLATLTGDGTKTAFDLPSDYDRMVKDGNVHSSRYQTAYFSRVDSLDDWILIGDLLATASPGNWIVIGGQMNIKPAMASNETARFYYISKNITVTGNASFSGDGDEFLLPERLLTLGLIWRWRSQKRLEYAEDLQNYEIALSEEIARDRGARIISVGTQRYSGNVSMPYPGALGQ